MPAWVNTPYSRPVPELLGSATEHQRVLAVLTFLDAR
jgi:hypothetical protein